MKRGRLRARRRLQHKLEAEWRELKADTKRVGVLHLGGWAAAKRKRIYGEFWWKLPST